jgi:elongator complex protein 3
LNDEILARNRRGHTVDDTRRAMRLLRLGGFKIVAHWMPNLLGATPESDLVDFERLWTDPGLRPDELKIYPTALLAGTTLAQAWQRGEYAPYDEATLVDLLAECKRMIAPTCRLNRLMRDIPTPNILAGVKRTNLRQIVRQAMADHGTRCTCIRCREVRGHEIDAERLVPERLDYETDGTSERFLSRVTPDGRLAGFLRLSLPRARPPVEELTGSAMVREIHIYGPALALGERRDERVQHAGLGSELLDEAVAVARQAGFERLSVIAAVGTRNYYRERGFTLDRLYMSRSI